MTSDFDTIRAIASRVGAHNYEGGVNGTCYECPFASEPLDISGRVARWDDISNDPTEAFFRCSLPGRDNETVVWGEHSPCSEQEWMSVLRTALARVQEAAEQAEKALGNLRCLAQEEIDNNPALGIPGYRKGMLARASLALLRGKDTR